MVYDPLNFSFRYFSVLSFAAPEFSL